MAKVAQPFRAAENAGLKPCATVVQTAIRVVWFGFACFAGFAFKTHNETRERKQKGTKHTKKKRRSFS